MEAPCALFYLRNTGLGNFNDDPALLMAAIDYLARNKPDS